MRGDVDRMARLLEAAIDRDQVIVSKSELLEQGPGELDESETLAKIRGEAIENAEILQAVWARSRAKRNVRNLVADCGKVTRAKNSIQRK
jgi:hypothetical protein